MAAALSRLQQLLNRVPQDLRHAGVRSWAVVGGIAVALLTIASPEDLERARSLLRLIAERGFARGKDLLADLISLLA